MDTIEVTGVYNVHAKKVLEFHNTEAFYLVQSGDQSPVLNNKGSVTVTGNQAIGASTEFYTRLATIKNFADATFDVLGLHGATGFSLTSIENVLTNDGDIYVSGGDGYATGVSCSSSQLTFTNGGHLRVEGSNALGVSSDFGQVISTGTFEVIGSDFAQGMLSSMGWFTNAGQMLVHGGASGAVGVSFDMHRGMFTNTGTLTVTADHGVSTAILQYGFGYQAAELSNSGTIKADWILRDVGTGYQPGQMEVFDNSGSLYGDLDFGYAEDVLTNSGFIKGDVLLGQDDDSYVASGGGVVHGTIYGGLGDDTLAGAKAKDVIYGDDGGNSGQDGDDQISGGKGNDQLFGNGGNDTLIGGVGADQLDGGPGADRFVYLSVKDSNAAHADTITGLIGNDHVDLSAIDADVSTKGVDEAFTLVASLDGHAGELVVSYDAGADLTTLQGDVDGDGLADLVIYISGDQTAFSGYVL